MRGIQAFALVDGSRTISGGPAPLYGWLVSMGGAFFPSLVGLLSLKTIKASVAEAFTQWGD